jgi:hypothetical protein
MAYAYNLSYSGDRGRRITVEVYLGKSTRKTLCERQMKEKKEWGQDSHDRALCEAPKFKPWYPSTTKKRKRERYRTDFQLPSPS